MRSMQPAKQTAAHAACAAVSSATTVTTTSTATTPTEAPLTHPGADSRTSPPPPPLHQQSPQQQQRSTPSASSDFYKFVSQQKNSLMAFFDGAKKNDGTGSEPTTTITTKSATTATIAAATEVRHSHPFATTSAAASSSPMTEMQLDASPRSLASDSSAVVTDKASDFATHNDTHEAATASAGAATDVKDAPTGEDFFSYFAIPGMYTDADKVMQRHAIRMGIPEDEMQGTPASSLTGIDEGKRESAAAIEAAMTTSASTGPTTATDTTAAEAAPNSAASSFTQPTHVHQLRPTQFFVPTLCEVCRRAVLDTKVWPPPSNPSTSSTATFFFSKLLLSPTSSASDALQPPTSGTNPSTAASAPPRPAAASPANTSSPVQQPFLGFGSEGYHCEVCDLALHRQCLRKLRETQACEVLAPAAHQMPEDKAPAKTSSMASDAAKADESCSSSSSSRNSSFTWDSVKGLLGNYLDPNGGAYSRKDANVKFVLSGVFALLDTVASRYPNLTPLTFVKRRQAIQDLSEAHQALYAACTSSLSDSQLLTTISWEEIQEKEQARTAGGCRCSDGNKHAESKQKGGGGVDDDGINDDEDAASQQQLPTVSVLTREMHPLKMDTSLFSQLTSSLAGTTSSVANKNSNSSNTNNAKGATPTAGLNSFLPEFAKLRSEEVTGTGAAFPVQLVLWRALRYATAVYGEVYRRGSLSSTVSAALLFTVKRSSVDVAKEANDAAVTALLELPPSALRLSRWAAKATEPSYVLLVDHALGHIVVSFRGTLNTFDIMTDLAAVGVPFCGGHAHQGAAHVVNALFDHRASQYARKPPARPPMDAESAASTATATAAGARAAGPAASTSEKEKVPTEGSANGPDGVEVKKEKDSTGKSKLVLEPYSLKALETPDGLLDGLEQLAEEHPTYSILITGHSLGGGIAVLFATRLHHDRVFPESLLRRLHVIAFAPMPTLSLPAASCFDVASCEAADGGFHDVSTSASPASPSRSAPQHEDGRRSEGDARRIKNGGGHLGSAPDGSTADCEGAGTAKVRQACFPVWNIVNGFDCVPRLQVNTIDRLLRQVVGPQIAQPTDVADDSPQTGASNSSSLASASSSSSRATAAQLRQRCRGEGRDRAWVELHADSTAVEMQDMSPSGAAGGVNSSDKMAPTASALSASSALPTSSATADTHAGRAELPATTVAALAHDTATAARTNTAAPCRDNTPASTSLAEARVTTTTAKSTLTTARSSEVLDERETAGAEPAWACDARRHLGSTAAEEREVVIKGAGDAVKEGREEEEEKRKKSAAKPSTPEDPVAVAAAAAGIAMPSKSETTNADASTQSSRGAHDLSHELHHPGRVLLLTSPWDVAQNRLVDVPRGHPVMHELFLMKYMLLQHSVDAYCGSVTEVHNRPSRSYEEKA